MKGHVLGEALFQGPYEGTCPRGGIISRAI